MSDIQERICKVNGCGGKIKFWKSAKETGGKNRNVSLYRCNKCKLLYGPEDSM